MSSYLPTKGEDVVRESRDGGIAYSRGTNSAPCCIVCAGSVPHEALVGCCHTNYRFPLGVARLKRTHVSEHSEC